MKKIFILICILQYACFAQEGFIKYNVKADIFDPKMKENTQKMNDPEVQAQLKAMQEQMKSPEMQKMMEQNPQLKAQMEMMAGLGNGENVLEKLIPKSMTISFKNGNSLMKLDGGFATEVLYLLSKNQSYQLNRKQKTYKIIDYTNEKVTKPKEKAIKTNETKKILGYTCTKYVVTNTVEKQTIWATTEILDFDFRKAGNFNQNGNGLPDGIEGTPLKFEISSKEMNIVFEVVEYLKKVPEEVNFVIPADFVLE